MLAIYLGIAVIAAGFVALLVVTRREWNVTSSRLILFLVVRTAVGSSSGSGPGQGA